jgi:hypothetical protein
MGDGVRQRVLLLVIVVLACLGLPGGAVAHDGVPETVERVQAGPYALELRYYSTPRAGQNLLLLVVPLGGLEPEAVRIDVAPGAGVEAQPVRVRTAPDPDDPTATDALFAPAAPGLWVITIAADGAAGVGRAETGIIVAAPGAVPVPVGWAIGLSPLIGIVGFAVAQRRWLRNEELRMTNVE